MDYYSNLYNKKAENVNATMTFEGLRNEFIKAASGVYALERENAAAIKELKESNIYSDKYIQDKEAILKNKEAAAVSECILKLEAATKKAIETKKEAINKLLVTAPTQEQLNLLQSLKMQGKSLSKIEISAILPELANNYRALKIVQTIAQSVGFNIVLPAQYDYEELKASVDKAESYLKDRIEDIGKPVRQWSTASSCFYGPIKYNLSAEEWERQKWEDPNYSNIAEVLDGNIQTAPIIEPVKELTESEKTFLNAMFANKQGEELKEAVTEAAKSPNLAELITRSDYAEHIIEA